MRAKFLLVGTVLATVVLYAWQVASNVALPWHEATMREFADDTAVVQALRANAPHNGVYFAPQGVLASINMTPDFADKTQAMGMMMARQVPINILVALVLTVLVLRMRPDRPFQAGITLGLAGLAAGLVTELSNWNWYGYAMPFSLVNAIDLAIMLGLAGLSLGLLCRKWMLRAVPDTLERPGVRAESGLPAAGRGSSSRV